MASKSADAATNPRGIPTAPFVEKVEDYIATQASSIRSSLPQTHLSLQSDAKDLRGSHRMDPKGRSNEWRLDDAGQGGGGGGGGCGVRYVERGVCTEYVSFNHLSYSTSEED
ncbi:hypothetical protein EV426DRAFT_698923 [Tirmania nivea]|nr:hypothetical protein EV426DRAFT_698923 [Tirmania nivea]